jgi:hypothetical protein
MNLEFSRQIFEKSSNIKYDECPSSVSRVVPCGQGGPTDRHDETNSLSSQFYERAWKGGKTARAWNLTNFI